MATRVPVRVNGVLLTNARVTEDFDISGMFVRQVHIDAPDFEVRRKGDE